MAASPAPFGVAHGLDEVVDEAAAVSGRPAPRRLTGARGFRSTGWPIVEDRLGRSSGRPRGRRSKLGTPATHTAEHRSIPPSTDLGRRGRRPTSPGRRRLPGRSVPRSASPSARAALRVTPASASSGVRPSSVQARLHGQPQRQERRRSRVGVGGDRHRHARRPQRRHRRAVGPRRACAWRPATGRRPCPAAASARTPLGGVCSRWSADRASKRCRQRRAAAVGELVGVELDR